LDLELQGRRAVVTGASRGIGKQIARILIEEGARVALVARHLNDLEATAAELGSNSFPVTCDASKDESVKGRLGRQGIWRGRHPGELRRPARRSSPSGRNGEGMAVSHRASGGGLPRLWAGSQGSGVWRSIDAGREFAPNLDLSGCLFRDAKSSKDGAEPLSPTGSIDRLFPVDDPSQQPFSLARDELEVGHAVAGILRSGGHEVSDASKRSLVGAKHLQVQVHPEHRIPKGDGLFEHGAHAAPMDGTRAVTSGPEPRMEIRHPGTMNQ
jgi:hypothetical protein